MPEAGTKIKVMSCPRCDREYTATGRTESVAAARALNIVKRHVARAHPEHDPEWADE